MAQRLTGLCVFLALPALAMAADTGEEPNIFAGGLSNAIITLVVFVIVVTILGKYAWPPLMKRLEEREETIRGSLLHAKQEREAAEKLLADYQAQVAKARDEATAIVEEGRRDAEAVRQRMHEEARAEADQMIERAKREIGLARDAAVKELYDQTAELAVNVASGIIKKSLSPTDHGDLVQQSLEQMKAADKSRWN